MARKLRGKNLYKSDWPLREGGRKTTRKRYRTREEIIFDEQLKYYEVVSAPKQFSLITNPQKTIQFINRLEGHYLKREQVFVELDKVEFLDYSAVTVLLSVMFSFKARDIKFNGNFPKEFALAKMLIDSEFFKYLKRKVNNKIEYTIGKQNQIFTRANKEVNSELGLPVMHETSTTIWNEPRLCKGLQRTLIELMQNTNNHASTVQKGEKHWWLSVNHDRVNKKVLFVFVDYGVGIFESLKQKPVENKWHGWFDKLKNKIVHGDNDEILKLLLEGEMHMTVTGQHFRGKGLPGIKEVMDRNQISNLYIVSNDVFADVSAGKYRKIKHEFSGTFVTWEISQQNTSLPWTI